MSDITLVRVADVEITEADREATKRVIFGTIDGLGEDNRKRWRRFWWGVLRMEAGEVAQVKTNKPRSGPFHRRHMKIETAIFESQDRFTDFDFAFRGWLKTGASHCEWYPGPSGKLFPVPKSTSYQAMEDGEMRDFHDNAMAFLRTEYAACTLWPHLDALAAMNMMHTILERFSNDDYRG